MDANIQWVIQKNLADQIIEMSFGRGDLTNPVTYNSNNSYQNNFDDDKYVKLTNQISSSIHTITQNGMFDT